ncbi:MAG: metallophosphoesterase [Nanoarchaeota archaeon]|nr:metallophosphoesterase [Nanoarchaeota archaeon]
MEKEKILKFCFEKNLLLDKDLLEIFSSISNFEDIRLVLEKLKNQTNKRFITKQVILENDNLLKNLISRGSLKNKTQMQELTIKLGINLEISAKQKIVENQGFSGSVNLSPFSEEYPKPLDTKSFVTYFRNRFKEMRGFLQDNLLLTNLISINKLNEIHGNFSVIGIVSDKRVSKNKNIIFEIEDLTGRVKVLINNKKEDLYEKAQEIVLDSVVGFKCNGNKSFLFANEIVLPEVNLPFRKKSPVEEYAVFLGDIHYGSKNFMEKEFLSFIDYLNGKFPNTPEVNKIKYLFMVGDIITGVGNYPNQDRDLKIPDLEGQFQNFANLLKKIRKDIKIIIGPGNHDGVRLMEPQPILNEKYSWPLHELENVFLIENPSIVNIASNKNFEGFDVLMYHGFSYPYYANNVPSLMKIKATDDPQKIMHFLLRNRHLAPSHGSVQYFPYEKDTHIIRKAPDIFVSGHLHKSGVSYHNNVLVIAVSSWETLTPYQEKFGNEPDHCKVPLVNLKTRAIKILDFENPNSFGGKNEC